jgi:hypothetical protein
VHVGLGGEDDCRARHLVDVRQVEGWTSPAFAGWLK